MEGCRMNPAMLMKMQKQLMKAQKELEESTFTGKASGGVVEVEVNGTKKVLGVKINPDAVDADDVSMLEDLVMLAINDAMEQIDAKTENTMGKVTGGMKIPGLF